MLLKIKIPAAFIPESSYVFRTLFSYFKGVEIEFVEYEGDNYVIEAPSGKTIQIDEVLFKQISEDNYHPNVLELPKTTSSIHVELGGEKIKVEHFYGKPDIIWEADKVHIQSDIVAASFIMLSRIEEFVLADKKDQHSRFPDEHCLAIKNGFQNRPIVNEYIELFRLILSDFEGVLVEYNRDYQVYVTHDVDEIYGLFPFAKFIKKLGADLIRRKSINAFSHTLKTWLKSLINKGNDPSYTFDFLMDVSDEFGVKSYFYFIPGKEGEIDFRYNINDSKISKIIKNIESKNHIVGFHPSYSSFDQFDQLKVELNRLSEVTQLPVNEGRQHFLRFDIHKTISWWNDLGLKTDSTVGFYDYVGFKSGMCYEYPFFDAKNRVELSIKERPLTVMEVALKRAENNPEKFKTLIIELAKEVKSYQGDFVLLWHNSNLYSPQWKEFGVLYKSIIKSISQDN